MSYYGILIDGELEIHNHEVSEAAGPFYERDSR
jgi:hypothetical protein